MNTDIGHLFLDRILLAYGGVEYENSRFKDEEKWPEIKESK